MSYLYTGFWAIDAFIWSNIGLTVFVVAVYIVYSITGRGHIDK